MKYKLFFSFLMILGSFVFPQLGEIVNVQAAQKTDGSGTVEIQYTLLPDETFPSFTVTPYALYPAHSIDLVTNEDGNVDVYLSTGNSEIYHLQLSFSQSDCGEIDGAIFSDELTDFETYYYDYSNGGALYYDIGFTCSSHPDCPVIPALTQDVLLYTLQGSNLEECVVNAYNVGPFPNIPENCTEINVYGQWDECQDLLFGREYYQLVFGYNNDYIEAPSGGLGANVLPGTYTFYWHLPGGSAMEEIFEWAGENGVVWENIKIRIIATSEINEAELPFEMVTIPSGEFYASEPIYSQDENEWTTSYPTDYVTELRTMDYNYQIMKYEITNSEIVTWALQNDDVITSDLQVIASRFKHINFDGGTLTIDNDYEDLPAAFNNFNTTQTFSDLFMSYSCSEGECIGPMNKFLDYYGLRLPDRYEWEYAARGPGSNSYFPWSNTTMGSCSSYYPDCQEINGGNYDGYSCDPSCFTDAFCIDGDFPFSMEGIYLPGTYENASPFGVYDMLGNVSEIFLNCNHGINGCSIFDNAFGAKGFDSYNYCNFGNYTNEPPTSCDYTNSMDCQEVMADAIGQFGAGTNELDLIAGSCEAQINSCSNEIFETYNMLSPYADYPRQSNLQFKYRYVGLRLVRTVTD